MVAKCVDKNVPKSFDRRALGQKFSCSSHFPSQRIGAGLARRPSQDFTIARNRHGSMLKETRANATLCASGDFSPLDGQFITGRRKKARWIDAIGARWRLARFRR